MVFGFWFIHKSILIHKSTVRNTILSYKPDLSSVTHEVRSLIKAQDANIDAQHANIETLTTLVNNQGTRIEELMTKVKAIPTTPPIPSFTFLRSHRASKSYHHPDVSGWSTQNHLWNFGAAADSQQADLNPCSGWGGEKYSRWKTYSCCCICPIGGHCERSQDVHQQYCSQHHPLLQTWSVIYYSWGQVPD